MVYQVLNSLLIDQKGCFPLYLVKFLHKHSPQNIDFSAAFFNNMIDVSPHMQVGNMAWKSSSLTHFGKAPNLFHYRSYTEALIASKEDPVAGWIHNLVLNE